MAPGQAASVAVLQGLGQTWDPRYRDRPGAPAGPPPLPGEHRCTAGCEAKQQSWGLGSSSAANPEPGCHQSHRLAAEGFCRS